jgi:hypothetical protein
MGNLTDFFAAGGGGGGGIGKTVTVGDYSYPNAQDIDFWAKEKYMTWSTNVGSYIHKLYTPNSGFASSYEVTTTTNNTYATVANITSAANGGGIYLLTSQNNNYGNNASTGGTFKITIDGGAPKEYTFYSHTSPYGYFGYIGKGVIIHPAFSNNSYGKNTIGEVMIAQPGQIDGAFHESYDATSETFYQQTTWTDAIMGVAYTAEKSAQLGLPYVHFASSCLVEYKAVSAANVKAQAQILTF